jgi:murein DD-endopeptidase MepM/ murein hydrolase activator NlpD
MTEKLETESIMKDAIKDMKEEMRDTEEFRTSSLLTDITFIDEGLLNRTMGRRAVLNHLDNLIEEKFAENVSHRLNTIDIELEQITQNREIERAALRQATGQHRSKRNQKRSARAKRQIQAKENIPTIRVQDIIESLKMKVNAIGGILKTKTNTQTEIAPEFNTEPVKHELQEPINEMMADESVEQIIDQLTEEQIELIMELPQAEQIEHTMELSKEEHNGLSLELTKEEYKDLTMELSEEEDNELTIDQQEENHELSLELTKEEYKDLTMELSEEEHNELTIYQQEEPQETLIERAKDDSTESVIDSDTSSAIDSFVDGIFIWYHRATATLGNKMSIAINKVSSKISPILDYLVEEEAETSTKLAKTVDRIDIKVDIIVDKASALLHFAIQSWNQAREWAEGHKRYLLTGLAACVATAAAAAIIVGNLTAYEYLYNDKPLGIVKDPHDVYNTIDIIGDKLTYAYGAEIHIDKEQDISFRKVMGWGLDIDNKDDVLNTLTYLRDMNANAYAIVVDGKQLAILDKERKAEEILQTIKDKFLSNSENIEYKSVDFAEKVEIKQVSTRIANIDKADEILEYMLTGGVEIRVHVVKSGETFNQIAKDCGVDVSELQSSNPDAKPESLHIGQELVLNKVCPVITVQTTEIATYLADINYDITYEETSTLYQGEQTVKSVGIRGKREVVAEIVRNNGVEVTRNELSSEIISEPRSQVVLKGTKKVPPLIGTGTFIYPTRGRLTSGYGTRWGRMHYGIDLAAPTGTKIRASDGGTVIYAGWDGALGYTVRIDHGGNRTTVYGHCSKIVVSKGDKVYQDQHIANVGNSGRSTGPHVHFEVRINGVAQNPLKYLR